MSLSFSLRQSMGALTLDVSETFDAPITGVFGPSGSGKTTLLHLLAGIQRPERGRIQLGDRTLLDSETKTCVPAHQRRIAVVFQEGRLFPHLNVRENLCFGYRPQQRPGGLSFDQVVETLGLADLIEKRSLLLSGGERQRVALGRALLCHPQLLLLDEPLASLDRGLARQLLPQLRQIQSQTGIPMIYVSHNLAELLQLTQQLWLVQAGKKVAYGDFMDLVVQPEILPLFHDLGLLNVVDVQLLGQHEGRGMTRLRPVLAPDGPIWHGPLSSEQQARLCVSLRPEDIALVSSKVPSSSIQNQIEGKIARVVLADHRALVVVDVGIKLLAEVTPHAVSEMRLQPGSSVVCLFKAQALKFS